MRRRDFIKAFGRISTAWLSAAHAQQATKIPRIGVLWHAGKTAARDFCRVGHFRDVRYWPKADISSCTANLCSTRS
jgi:hypothetical protein